MKKSQYNNYIPLKKGYYILYNTLSGAILIVDEDTKTRIETLHQGAHLPQEVIEKFTKTGVLVDVHKDELLQCRDTYNRWRYNQQSFSFSITPTTRCNLSCEYCWQRIDQSLIEKGNQIATMSEATLKGVLTFAKQKTEELKGEFLPIVFFGGEPLLEKDMVFYILEDLEQWSKEHSVHFTAAFYTNCTLVDKPFLDELATYDINQVRTTLDGPQKINDQYRCHKNGKGTYEEIVTAMEAVLDAGIKVTVQVNANRHYTHLPALFDDLAERGLTQITVIARPVYDPPVVIQEVQKAYKYLDESFCISPSKFAVPFNELPEIRTRIFRWAFERGFNLPPPHLGLVDCHGAQYYQYIIDPSGDVYKCVACMLLKFMRVGHIHENGHFETYPYLYEWMDTDPTYIEECQSCSFLPTCGGGCVYGRKLIHVPYVCEVSSFCGEEYIKLYLKQQYPEKMQSLV